MLDITTAAQLIDAIQQLAFDNSVSTEDIQVNIGSMQTRAELTVSIDGLDVSIETTAPAFPIQDSDILRIDSAVNGYMEDCISSPDYEADRAQLTESWHRMRFQREMGE